MKTIRLPKGRSHLNRREKSANSPRVVVVPIDFSPLSDAALQRGKQFAKQFGSKLHLIHVVEPIIQPVEFAIVPPEMEEVNTRLVSERKARLETIKQTLRVEGIPCQVQATLGKPWRTIVDYAKRAKCDLIVIATHGRTGPKHLFMGSTAERVVQHAPCSVLVAR